MTVFMGQLHDRRRLLSCMAVVPQSRSTPSSCCRRPRARAGHGHANQVLSIADSRLEAAEEQKSELFAKIGHGHQPIREGEGSRGQEKERKTIATNYHVCV